VPSEAVRGLPRPAALLVPRPAAQVQTIGQRKKFYTKVGGKGGYVCCNNFSCVSVRTVEKWKNLTEDVKTS